MSSPLLFTQGQIEDQKEFIKELDLNSDLSELEAELLSLCPFWIAKCRWSQPVGQVGAGRGQDVTSSVVLYGMVWTGRVRMLTRRSQTD